MAGWLTHALRSNAERPLYSGSVAQADRRDALGAETGQPAAGAEPGAGPLGAEPLGAEPGGTAQLDRPLADDQLAGDQARAGDTGELPADVAPSGPEGGPEGAPEPGQEHTEVLRPVRKPGVLARARTGFVRTGRGLRHGVHRGARAASERRTSPAAAGRPPEDIAASALARLTTLPALLMMAWLIPGLPLLLAGDFVPIPMLLISAPLLVALVANGLRVVPSAWPRLVPGRRDRGWTSWFGLMATVAVAAGFAAWQFVEHSESVVVLRAQGVYLQTGYWLAQHGSLPIPQSLHAFGGAHAGLGFSSIGFFTHGTSVVPSLTSGLPMLLAGGFWAHGVPGAAAMGPLLAGLAVLSFGGLTARLAGPQWAPAGAIVLGLALPEQYTARSSLAEPVLQVLLFGGLCLLVDAMTVRPEPTVSDWLPPEGWRRLASARAWTEWLTPERTLAGLAGLALGLGVLVSLDSLIYLLPLIPVAGLLVGGRLPGATSFCYGAAIGVGYGLADGYLLSRPFLDSISHTMEFIGLLAAWLAVLTMAIVQLLRVSGPRAWVRRIAARRPVRWLPALGGLIAVGALAAFAVRPYIQTVRGVPNLHVYHYIALLQRLQGLPIDPTRTYAEDSLYWVIWYIGLPTVLLGGFGLALLVRQTLNALLTWEDPVGAWRNWALPLAIFLIGSFAILWQPAIVPDQPWASRRLVVIVLPGLIICALWAAAWLTGHARERGARGVTAGVAGVFCVTALVVPTAATTFGAGLEHTGRGGGLRPSAQGLAFRRTGIGELAAVEGLCGSLRHDSSVVIVDPLVAARFTQVIRGMCGVPTAWMVGQPAGAVDRVVSGIMSAGRHPVVLGSRSRQLSAFGGNPVRVLDLSTLQDPHNLTSPPTTPSRVHFSIWMVTPQPGAVGA